MKHIVCICLFCLFSAAVYGQSFKIEKKLTGSELYDEFPQDTTWVANVVVGDLVAKPIRYFGSEYYGEGTWEPFVPSLEEIKGMESCIRDSYAQLRDFQSYTWGIKEPKGNLYADDCYTRYFRQYIFLRNAQGKKLMLLTCITFSVMKRFSQHEDLREGPLHLFDGGDNYWKALYDMNNKKVLIVKVNGSR